MPHLNRKTRRQFLSLGRRGKFHVLAQLGFGKEAIQVAARYHYAHLKATGR